MAFAFDPTDGIMNTTSFPNKPATSTAARQQFQTLLNQLRDYINTQTTAQQVPVGAVFMIFHQTIPTGYLELKGQTVNKSEYMGLWNLYGPTYGASSTTFTLPDMRGAFARGWDNGKGRDTGRIFGSYQEDEIKSHIHNERRNDENGTPPITDHNTIQGLWSTKPDMATTNLDTGATGGVETRPKNIACIFIVKY